MAMDKEKREEVYKILLSLLVARQGPSPVTVLDRDYYEAEGERIPWRKLGHTDIIDFLLSAPDKFLIQPQHNGGHWVYGIASNKSRHVSSLVARQKSTKPFMQRTRRPAAVPYTPPPRVSMKIPSNDLHHLVNYICSYPDGVSMQHIQECVERQLPYMTISVQDLRKQLCEVQHQLRIDGEKIYPAQSNHASRNVQNYKQPPPLVPELQNASYSVKEYPGGDEGSDYEEEDITFNETTCIPAGCISNNSPKPRMHGRLAINLLPNINDVNSNMYLNMQENDSDHVETIDNIEQNNEPLLISERIQMRLKQLLEKHPNGIWCADLPELYLEEYKVHLNYLNLGFTSVRGYAAYLTDIFYMVQPNATDDFLLFSVDKRPKIEKILKLNTIEEAASLKTHERHDDYGARAIDDDEDPPIPSNVSPDITKRFAPENVMNYNDSVDCIRVTDLIARKKMLKAYVIEVFNPSFFWIQLYENRKVFDKFMHDLSEFYKFNSDKYIIPKVALKKGLNCACIYDNMWHRSVIKSVKPDFRVTLLFYDFGTLKTYAPEEVYYLHKRFSSLPAQAIPCGLYNIKPIFGDRWKKSVNNQFVDRIDGQKAVLSVTIKTIDEVNNSMMIDLIDISEDGETNINEWLVNEKLAKCGQMVRINDSNLYLNCNDVRLPENDKSVVDLNEVRYNKNLLISPDQKTHRLSDAKSEDLEKENVEDLRNVPSGKRLLFLKLKSLSSQKNAKSNLEETKPKTFEPTESHNLKTLEAASNSKARIAKLLEANRSFEGDSRQISTQNNAKSLSNSEKAKPKTLEPTVSNNLMETFETASNSKARITKLLEANRSFEGDSRQISTKVESQQEEGGYCGFYMGFGTRDSDDEETLRNNDFGEFHSLFGGQGSNHPFDWSIINDDKPPPRKPIAADSIRDDYLDTFIKEVGNNLEDKSESDHKEETDLSIDEYYLNFVRKKEEYYSPCMNIEFNKSNLSSITALLKNRMQIRNNKFTQVIASPNIFETLCQDDHSQDACNANAVRINSSASSSEKMITRVVANKNGDVCETKADGKRKNSESSDADSKLASPNVSDNGSNNNNEISEIHKNYSPDFNKTRNLNLSKSKLKLLNRIRESQMNSSKSSISKKSSSSEQILSSSYSFNTSTEDIISSSDNDQSKVLCTKTLGVLKKKPYTSTLSAQSASLNNSDLSNDSETNKFLSPSKNESALFNALDDSTQWQLNCSSKDDSFISSDSAKQQLLNKSSDSIVSSDVVESKQLESNQSSDSISSSDVESKQLELNQSSDVVEPKQLQLDFFQPETDYNAFFDKLNNSQVNTSVNIASVLKLFQTSKNVREKSMNHSELDSDDLSDEEKSDKSCNTESDKSCNTESDKSCNTESDKSANEPLYVTLPELSKKDTNEIVRFELPVGEEMFAFNDIDSNSSLNSDDWDFVGDVQHFLPFQFCNN